MEFLSPLSKARQQLGCGLQNPELSGVWESSHLVEGKYSTRALAPLGVRIGESTLKGAGAGVYASRRFKRGDNIGAYIGVLRQRNDADDTTYHMEVPNCSGVVYDATDKAKGNFTRFVNTNYGTSRPRNCQFKYVRGLVVLRATRTIQAGEELLEGYPIGEVDQACMECKLRGCAPAGPRLMYLCDWCNGGMHARCTPSECGRPAAANDPWYCSEACKEQGTRKKKSA